MKQKLLALSILSLITIIGCKQKSPQQRVQEALENVLKLSPATNDALHSSNIPIIWSIGNLNGRTLAETKVFWDHAEIIFDWQEIQGKRERLEPIIAHEIYHYSDAYKTFGFENFVSLVDQDKNNQWKDRILEKRAVTFENSVRAYLLKTNPQQFKGMSPERKV